MMSSHLVCSFIGIAIHLLDPTGCQETVRVGGTATQSSVCSEGGRGPGETKRWWRLELSGVYRVGEIEVTIKNKDRDNNLVPIVHTQILIGNSLENNGNNNPRCATFANNKLVQTFQCRGMEGQYINIYKPCGNGRLLLIEVNVHGELAPPPNSISTTIQNKNVTLVAGKRLCWSDALLYCRDFHSDLLSIKGPKQQEMIQQLVARAPFPLTSHLWIGLRRSNSNNTWFWMTGTPLNFTQWEPNHFPLQQPRPCGGIASMEPFTWKRDFCYEQLDFICVKGRGEKQVRFYASSRDNVCGV